MGQPAVEVTGLVKRYGAKTAVDGLNLQVETGTITAVLGPNGAGKTSTIECCEGYRKPDGGTVRVLGLDPVAEGERLRPRIGVMLQSGGIYPTVRAVEMLEHTAKLYANPLDTGALIERLGLGSAGRTPFRRLSGGQQQRLSLALAVVGRPELVFLDEPTAGLDVQARHATWELIEQLRRDGVTVVLTTHLLDEAERLADSVAIVDAGRVIAHDTPAGLAAANGTADTAIRFTAPPGLDLADLLAGLPAGLSAVEQPPGGYTVGGDITPDVLARVTAWCAAKDVMPQGLSVGRRTLEDVFLDLTGRELR
ncbi:ABC transporter ATP-binding protein [Catenulispora yoronensis]|uniref:ABC transporter ATP-binding protein n=1 Tax=Catenulispora yoronensis TaxID=450799 RepID=A0ABP5FH47_9ACTN